MHILNIGILAHVDAGKTSLTERLLFQAGAIDRLGSVDEGSTQTDSGDIERRRGITIRTAVASFTVENLRINLIDTPGHADFVAEVERALGVLDGAVLVLSAVEGVQPHTRVLMKTLRRLRLPTLIFVNKIDRAGAREREVLAAIRRWLSPYSPALNTVQRIGTRDARTTPLPGGTNWPSVGGHSRRPLDVLLEPLIEGAGGLAEVLAEHDDGLLEVLVEGREPGRARVRAALERQCADGVLHPVLFGSAMTGEGVGDLVDAFALLPAVHTEPAERTEPAVHTEPAEPAEPAEHAEHAVRKEPTVRAEAGGRAESPGRTGAAERAEPAGVAGLGGVGGQIEGVVFAIERGGAGEKLAYVRMRSGTLRARQRVTLYRRLPGGGVEEYGGRVSGLRVSGLCAHGTEGPVAGPGDIALVWGVPEVRVGDCLGRPPEPGRQPYFAPPSLETVVRARVPEQQARLHATLAGLAEQDPLIATRTLDGGETSVLLYGEVQKEVIAETLAGLGVDAVFEPSRPVYLERPVGTAEAVEEIQRHGRNELWATVGLRVEPGPVGSGVGYRLGVDLGSLPLAFHRAIEDSVRDALRRGPHGWPVTDCLVTLVRTGYASPVSTAGDFRARAPVVLARALRLAGTRVYEPCHRFEVEIPPPALSAVTARLAVLGADVAGCVQRDEGWSVNGDIPARTVHAFERELPGLSHGEGVWWSQPSGDRPVRPARHR
ncbi:translation factor GTPase family protein [Nonomuraea sp. NPDC005983]|uniref:translation factor GTPase family protein n=1 Tax=Nonomuraea sp. NPDC005983 TaxID=3155595 RepID=UPI00339F59AE